MLRTSAYDQSLISSLPRQSSCVLPEIVRIEHLPTLDKMHLLILKCNELPGGNFSNALHEVGREHQIFADHASFNAVVIETTCVIYHLKPARAGVVLC